MPADINDGRSQVRQPAALAADAMTWLRDEEETRRSPSRCSQKLDRIDDLSSLGLVLTQGQETSVPKFL